MDPSPRAQTLSRTHANYPVLLSAKFNLGNEYFCFLCRFCHRQHILILAWLEFDSFRGAGAGGEGAEQLNRTEARWKKTKRIKLITCSSIRARDRVSLLARKTNFNSIWRLIATDLRYWMRWAVICGCGGITTTVILAKNRENYSQRFPGLLASRLHGTAARRWKAKPLKHKEIGNTKNHDILCNISMARLSGRFSWLETGIPPSTRSIHLLLPGIPALQNRSHHSISFYFSISFWLALLREFAKQHKKFFDF